MKCDRAQMHKPIPQPPHLHLPSPDPALTRCVTASTEEIQRAQEMRRLIEQRYLERPALPGPSPYWWVVAD